MTSTSADLLRLLNPGVNPAAPAAPAHSGPAPAAPGVDHATFADLLARAQSGELVTGLPVTVEAASGVQLDEAQLARLSLAADRAEAAGIRTALVLIDGRALVMDVASRTISREVSLTADAVTGIDGVVPVPSTTDAAADAAPVKLPPAGLPSNASVTALLGSLEPRE